MKIFILRLGHRIFRDQRLSTHVFLAARAFGCDSGYYSGQKDSKLESTIKKTSEQWGGGFVISHTENWKKLIRDFNGNKIHLTIYGLPFQEKLEEIKKENGSKNILLVVGGEKVPSEVYQLCDHNISVTNQPHSEVSSLACFLTYLLEGKDLGRKFVNPKLRVIPQERGKKVLGK